MTTSSASGWPSTAVSLSVPGFSTYRTTRGNASSTYTFMVPVDSSASPSLLNSARTPAGAVSASAANAWSGRSVSAIIRHKNAASQRFPVFLIKIPFPFLFAPSRSAGRVFAPTGTEGRTEKSPFRPVRIPYRYFFGNLLISQFSKVDFGQNDEIYQESFVFFAKHDVFICPRAVMSGVGAYRGGWPGVLFPDGQKLIRHGSLWSELISYFPQLPGNPLNHPAAPP